MSIKIEEMVPGTKLVRGLNSAVPVDFSECPTCILPDGTEVAGSLTMAGDLTGIEDITLDGQADRFISMARETTEATAGNDLTIIAGGSTIGSTDKAGGALYLNSGYSTGNVGSYILFNTATDALGSGTTSRAPTLKAWLASSSNSRFFIGNTTSVSGSGDGLNFTGSTCDWNILSTRHTTTNTAGNDLTVQAGGATLGATDKSGGTLSLSGGISTGSASGSSVAIKTYAPGSTGTTDQTAYVRLFVAGSANARVMIGNNNTTTTDSNDGINLLGTTDQYIYHKRETTAETDGKILYIRAGGATSGSTDKNGGLLRLTSGIATGSGTSYIQFYGVAGGQASGTIDRSPTLMATISGSLAGRLTIGTNFTGAVDGLNMTGEYARNVLVTRHSTTNTAGNYLNVQAGGATSGATDKAGGELSLKSGISTGTGESAVVVYTSTPGSTGTTDNTQTEKFSITGKGNIVVGTAAVATNATDGFLYITSCAGTPTGVPTTKTGRTPIVYDTTNNKLYVYNGAWKGVTFS